MRGSAALRGWEDMDLILRECERRQMKVWLLDDKHFPTGAMPTAY